MIEICNLRKTKPKNDYDIKVDRTSILGNPFYMKDESMRDDVCDKYEIWFNEKVETNARIQMYLGCLLDIYKRHGKLRLFCWCSPKRCHAETIKRFLEEQIER